MRSTSELITELEEESTKHWVTMMAIGFEGSTIFVQPNDKDRVNLLNSAILAGGTPVGLIAADKAGNELTMRARVYPEHEDSPELEGYVGELVEKVRDTLTE